MRIVRSKSELKEALSGPRREGRRIGLVPTMGYFHEGHLSLMRAARSECDLVVVSLFVNPTQFGPGEDLEAYPRDEERDAGLAEREGVDLLWIPTAEQMYPEGFATTVEVTNELTGVLEGDPEHRGPGHFRGVTTVVAKLFNAVQPDRAYFGRKDAQQALVIQRMVEDLDFPVEIRVLPTVREEDGLALSSRNAYLSPEDRQRALAISRGLRAAERAAREGETSSQALVEAALTELRSAGIKPEYVEARSAEDLSPIAELNGRPVLVAVAARVGKARLIDNVVITPTSRTIPTGGLMQRQMLKSKIHRATVTDCDVDYVGSITLDPELMRQADLMTNEQVHVWDIDNGARFVTYAIEGEPGSGTVQVNGAAARLVRTRDKVIVASFGAYDSDDLERYSPVIVHVSDDNEVIAVDSDPSVLLGEGNPDQEALL